MMNKKELLEQIENQERLIKILETDPLALNKLWNPICHRWDGLAKNSNRDRGCGKEMALLHTDVYFCSTCNITEKRSSQRTALLNMGKDAHLIHSGNRFGKSDLGSPYAVAVALGSDHWSVKEWLKNNNLPKDLIQPEPCSVWVVSISFNDALEYMRPKIDRFLPSATIKKNWKATGRAEAILPNGGRIVSMSYEMGWKKFQGGSVKLIWIDEEGDDPKVFEECLLRVGDQKGRVLITSTPVEGFSWSYDKFFEDQIEGFSKVSGSGLDNPFISSVKLRRLVSSLSASQQRARLFGEYTSQQGLIYDEFDYNLHVVKPFQIPKDARIYRTIDFGVRNPFACLWIYHDVDGLHGYDDALYVFREYYITNKTTIENGRKILQLSKDDPAPVFTVADSASKDARLILIREMNIATKPSPKELGMVAMINLVKERLQIAADGKPRLFFFKGCKNTISEIKKYRWEENKKKDIPKKADDHALDALRYAIGYLSRYDKINNRRSKK